MPKDHKKIKAASPAATILRRLNMKEDYRDNSKIIPYTIYFKPRLKI